MLKGFLKWLYMSIVVPIIVITDCLRIGRYAAIVTPKLVTWPAIVGIKIY